MKIFLLFVLISVSLGGDNIVNLANGNPRLTMSLFKKFQHDNGRTYPPSEQKMRYTLFKKSIERTAKWNAEEPSVMYGLTPFSGLTQAERDSMMGLNASLSAAYQDKQPHAVANTPIVGSANHRALYGAVKNQFRTSACWAFAVTALLEGKASELNGRYTALSDQETADCSPSGGIETGGYTLMALIDMKRQNHLTTEANHPFTRRDGKCEAALRFPNALPFKITRIVWIFGDNEQANSLRTSGPVVASINFDQRLQEYRGGIFANPSCNDLPEWNHAVAVIGYNDQAWTIRDSHGANWGEAGYGRITRATENMCNISVHSFTIEIEPAQEKEE